MRTYRARQDLEQNLRDAGCEQATIEAFLDEWRSGRYRRGMQLLQRHRSSLLDRLHAEQRRIECLDYLLYMLQKQNEP